MGRSWQQPAVSDPSGAARPDERRRPGTEGDRWAHPRSNPGAPRRKRDVREASHGVPLRWLRRFCPAAGRGEERRGDRGVAKSGEATAEYRDCVRTVSVPVPETTAGTRTIPVHHVRHAIAGYVAMPGEPGAPPMRAGRPSRWDARGAMLKGVTKGAPCPSARVRPPGKADAVSCGGWLQDSPYWPATTARGYAATCWPE